MRSKWNMLMILVMLLGMIGGYITPAAAEAIPCVVTDPANSADTAGTLNYWLSAVGTDGLPACSTITFSGDMTVLGPIQINHDVTIDGETYNVAITGDTDGDQVADQSLLAVGDLGDTFNPVAILKSLTLTTGLQTGYAPIENFSTLTLDHVRVVDNFGGYGSIASMGTLNVIDSYFSTTVTGSNNGILNLGTLNMTRTTFSGNVGTIDNNTYGGAFSPLATIIDSTFANSTSYQGIIWNEAGGALVVTNSTFSGNTTTFIAEDGFVGVIAIRNLGSMTLTNNTFADNRGLDAFTLYNDNRSDPTSTIRLFSNVFVEAADPTACAYNVYPFFPDESSSNLFTGYCGRTDLPAPDGFTLKTPAEINLGTLGNYGGPTQTIPLLPGSAAIDAGDASACPAADQRGVTRPQGAACDVGTYEYEPPTTYSISGQLFYDDNRNGVLDGDEYPTYFGEIIQLDQGCNGTVDASFTLTYYVQTFTFADLPAYQSYCIRYYNPGYRTTSPNPVTTSLSGDMTGVDIGFAYVYLDYDRNVDLNGPVGEQWSRTLPVTGGDGPYDFTGTAWISQPVGLDFTADDDAGTLTISGTPTTPEEGMIELVVQDANGADMHQYILFWTQTDAAATFASSQNPSNEGQQVTFNLEFQPDYPFYGYVTFYDGNAAIEGCSELWLAEIYNYWGATMDDNPAECSTSALSAGTHQIRAEYVSLLGGYSSHTYTLEQVVIAEAPPPVLNSISPASAVAGPYDVTFTVTGSGFTTASVVRWGGQDLATTYVSDTELSAVVPEEWMAIYTVEVTVYTPGGGTSNALAFFLTLEPAGVIDQDVASGTDPSASSGPATASATGDGLLVVAQYDANPGGAPSFTASGTYFDVYAAPGNTFSQVSIAACGLNASAKLYWWNPDLNQWVKASPQSYSDGCVTLIVDAGSSPSLDPYFNVNQLQGTIFAVGEEVASNTAPVANPGGPYLAAINTTIAFNGSASSDADGDPLTYTWNFGDGSTGTGAMPTHAYAAAGVYNACLTVNDGLVDSEEVCTLAVVYDPSAGFVTGGGWIDSPAGAYMADPSLAGKATFGFVSKYLKGASVPSGNTEFQFQAGNFNFRSTSYDWLVVSKDQVTAQFKGSGTVNGALDPNGNAYKFLLWAGDGTPDTFRIRIWWEDADGVEHDVYDNGFNQAIGGGSIVVHTK